jgi:hypothetical protein
MYRSGDFNLQWRRVVNSEEEDGSGELGSGQWSIWCFPKVSVLSSQGAVMRFNSIGRRGRERPLSTAGDGVFRRSSGVMSQSSLVHLRERKRWGEAAE